MGDFRGATMFDNALRLQLRDKCPFCRVGASATAERVIKGAAVFTLWCCDTCKREWPATELEHTSVDRGRAPDRRRTTASDRRKKN